MFDITPLKWSVELERKIKGWANRKPFGVTWILKENRFLEIRYYNTSRLLAEKAEKTLATIIRRAKKERAAAVKIGSIIE